MRVLRPVFLRKDGEDLRSVSFVRELLRCAQQLAHERRAHAWCRASARAYRAALAAQRRYERGLRAIGERSLAYAREHGYPVVLMAGETHVVHDPVLNSGIHDLVAANGALRRAGRLLSRAGLGAAARPRALGQREQHAARSGRRESGRRRLSAAARRLRLRSQLVRRAPLQRPARRLPAHRARERRSRRQGRLRDPRAGVPARRARREALHREDGAAAPSSSRAGRGRQRVSRATTSPVPRSLHGNEHRKMYFGNVGGALGRQLAAAMRGAGLDVEFVGADRRRGPARARDVLLGQGVPALPAHLGDPGALPRGERAGAGRRRLGARLGTPATAPAQRRATAPGDLPLFISIGRGFQACRANVFPTTQEIGLAGLGLGDRVEVADLTHALPGLDPDPGGLGRHRRRRPAQHDALLPLRDGARARRRRSRVRRLRRPAREAARAAAPGRRGRARRRGC